MNDDYCVWNICENEKIKNVRRFGFQFTHPQKSSKGHHSNTLTLDVVNDDELMHLLMDKLVL